MEKDMEIPNGMENLQENWSWCDSSRPKLRDLRALPSRGLGLHYTAGQFGVVTLPDARPPTGPAATVVRSTGVPEGRSPRASGSELVGARLDGNPDNTRGRCRGLGSDGS